MKKMPGDALSSQQDNDLEAFLHASFTCRVLLAAALVLAGLLTLFGRMFYLQVDRHDFYSTRSQSNRVRIRALVPERGRIFDRNGLALTENILRYRVMVSPAQLRNVEEALADFAAILPLSDEERDEFKKRLGQTRRYEMAMLKEGIDEQSYYRLSVMLYRLPGFQIEPYYERYYPFGVLTSHVLGYTNRINDQDLETLDENDYRGLQTIGRAGIERQYEERLRGRPGYQQVETDANGNMVRLLEEIPARRGQDVYLSLDAELQRFIYETMQDYRGSCVVLEPESGEVLALVSKPGYDANLFTRGISRRQYQRLLDDPHGPLYDRALKGRYPPGSVIKPMFSLAAYHYNIFNPQTTVHCPGHYSVEGQGGRRFHCWNRRGHGRMNADHAIRQVPEDLIPWCPRCGAPMAMNLRADLTFVEDVGWYQAAKRYQGFLAAHKTGRVLYLELGVGGNTPGIIKYPFWQRTFANAQARFVCINAGQAITDEAIRARSITINADIDAVLRQVRDDR